jgi:hypothetical protein
VEGRTEARHPLFIRCHGRPDSAIERHAAPGWHPDSEVPGRLRFWDGERRTSETQLVTPDQRRRALDRAVADMVGGPAQGWRVESRTEYQAVLVSGHRTNHLLHLVLTLATCGLWAIVWAILGVTNQEKRDVITADEYEQIEHRYGKP